MFFLGRNTIFALLLQEQYENVEGFVYDEKLDWGKLKRMVATPSNICVIMQGLPGSLPWGVLLTFLNDFLARDQHLSIGVATAVSRSCRSRL